MTRRAVIRWSVAAVLLAPVACRSTPDQIVVKEVVVLEPGATVRVGETVPLGVRIENAGTTDLTFEWRSENGGTFRSPQTDSPANFYTAPATSGADTISVLVSRPDGRSATGFGRIEVAPNPGAPTVTPEHTAAWSRSLLSGRVEPFGQFRKSCPPSVQGPMVMRIDQRIGDYAMCCVHLEPPVVALAGDTLSADLSLQQPERQVHVKIETTGAYPNFRTVFLHERELPAGGASVTRTLTAADLGTQEALHLARFCVVALGDGPLQTVTVGSATQATAARGQIQFPRAETGQAISARGTIQQLPPDGQLWLAVRKGDLLWPKEPAPTISGSTWTATIAEGATPAGGAFELALYFVLPEGNEPLTTWFAEGRRSGSFPGLPTIPGAVLLHSVPLRMAR